MRSKSIAIVGMWSVLALGAQAAEQSPETRAAMQPAPELQAEMAKVFADFIVPAGPVTILPPSAEVRAKGIFDNNPLLGVPVTFKASLRLDTPVTATVFSRQVTLAVGTVLRRYRFQRSGAETAMEVWCGNNTPSADSRDQAGLYCLARTVDGRGVLYIAPLNMDYTTSIYKGVTAKSPRVLAFGINPQGSEPFAYPEITRDDTLPSPPMRLLLQVSGPFKGDDRKTDFSAHWGLEGPSGSVPSVGRMGYRAVDFDGKTGRIRLGGHVVLFDFVESPGRITNVRLETAPVSKTEETAEAKTVENVALPEDSRFLRQYRAPLDKSEGRLGAMRIDLSSLKLQTVPSAGFATGDVILRGTAALADRHQVMADAVNNDWHIKVAKGAHAWPTMLEAYESTGESYQLRAWCYEATFSWMVTRQGIVCSPMEVRRFLSLIHYNEEWKLTGFNTTGGLMRGTIDLDLQPTLDAQPVAEPLSVSLGEVSVKRRTVQVRIALEKDGKAMPGYVQTLKFDESGTARLHLWSRVLTLRLVGERVTAEWSETTDIRSPAYQAR